jgi:hypothetical protein
MSSSSAELQGFNSPAKARVTLNDIEDGCFNYIASAYV